MTIYIPTPISEPQKEDGEYNLINVNNGEKYWSYWVNGGWYIGRSGNRRDPGVIHYTHYLRPVEGNVLTDEELEAVWDAAIDYLHDAYLKTNTGASMMYPDKDTYLKSIKK